MSNEVAEQGGGGKAAAVGLGCGCMGVVALVLTPILATTLLVAAGWDAVESTVKSTVCAVLGPLAPSSCQPASSDPAVTATATGVAGWSAEQVGNAVAIINAGLQVPGVTLRDQGIAVMTAIGESNLIDVTHGDAAGPDSLGLFQQRTSWGTAAQRLDPTYAATSFYKRLVTIPNRDSMEPTIEAHTVQVNANADYYAPYWEPACALVQALTGQNPAQASSPAQGASQAAAPDQFVGKAAYPIASTFTVNPTSYGWRTSPLTGKAEFHAGTDIPAPCGTPVYAILPGTIVNDGTENNGYDTSLGNDRIMLAVGGGVVINYLHSYPSGIVVHQGEQVAAGQLITHVGSAGQSTGCHLHFEVRDNASQTSQDVTGQPVDPLAFAKGLGIVWPGE